MNLDKLPLVALLDTGSDFDCIHVDLAKSQKALPSVAFVGDLDLLDQTAGTAFENDIEERKVKGRSEWNLTFYGSRTLEGPCAMHDQKAKLNEWDRGVGDQESWSSLRSAIKATNRS